MMFTKLTGTALQSAQMSIARYCIKLEDQSGAINIAHVVTSINEKYRLVSNDILDQLINDIAYAYDYLKNQEIHEISRAGYWKFRAKSPFEAKLELESELQALGA